MFKSVLSRITFTAISVVMLASAASAQTAILVVDSGKVIRDSSAGKSVQTQLKSIQSTIESEAKSTMSPLESEGRSLDAQMKTMTSTTDAATQQSLASKIQAYRQKGAKAQTEVQYKSAEYQATERKALIAISDKIDGVIEALARERGAALVVDKSSTIYSSSAIDVTQEVISRMNRQVPSIGVTRERLPRKS